MRKGVAISLLLHAGILFWAVAVFPDARKRDESTVQPIPVDVVTPAEHSRVKAGRKDAEKKEAAAQPQAEKQKPKTGTVAAKRPPSQPKIVKAPAPKPPAADAEPAPTSVARKKDPVPERKPVKTAQKSPAPPMPSRRPARAPKSSKPLRTEQKVARAEPKKKPFNPDDIAALLDKRPDAAPAPQPARKPAAAPAAPQQPARGVTRGQDERMTLSEIDALRARISQCWNPPVGGLGADAIRVKLRLQLNRDGMLAGRPQVVNRESSPFFQAAADSAVRAVMLCQPYQLPDTKFALWRDMILNFDPREMFGG